MYTGWSSVGSTPGAAIGSSFFLMVGFGTARRGVYSGQRRQTPNLRPQTCDPKPENPKPETGAIRANVIDL